jgi:triosephosphate isomerase
MRRPLIAGNWKLHKTQAETRAFAAELLPQLRQDEVPQILIAPPFTALAAAREAFADSPVYLGAQNCYCEDQGAYTGEVSAPLLRDAGCDFVILGHSERRHLFQEDNAHLRCKLMAALKAGLRPIFCLGETLEQRENDETETVLQGQAASVLSDLTPEQALQLTIAYEPVWAIGTGRSASPQQAQSVHAFLRSLLLDRFGTDAADRIRLLYGGSVKPDNVQELMTQPDIDGALVGGASLQAQDFLRLIRFNSPSTVD